MKHITSIVILIILFSGMQNQCFSQYKDGDTLKFWSVTYIDWPPLQGQPQRLVNAICRKAGNHCYVFVEDVAPQPGQANIDALVQEFDYLYYDSLTTHYGPVPNVFDKDSRIFILVLNESNWAGYFDPGQQMSDSMVYSRWNRHSSEREIIYVSASYFNSVDGIVAHEFGHLLHWQQDHSPEPIDKPVKYWEDAWVDEGFSTFSDIYLTENIYQHNIFDNGFFAKNPDIPLIYFSSYNQVKLFMLFMFEHFGGWNYISKLISNQLNGIKGIESTLKDLGYVDAFDDAFEQWVIANYVDDSSYAGGKYSYKHYRFPSCHISDNYTSFPTGLRNATVSPYGSDYITFTSSTSEPIKVEFQGQLNSKFRIDFILKDTVNNHIDSAIAVPMDSLKHATFIADRLGTSYNEIVMIVMNVDSTIHENNTASYSYSVENYTGISENNVNDNITVFPNPANDKLFIVLANNLISVVEIIDIQGKVHIVEKFSKTTTIDISGLTKGIYVLSLINNEGTSVKKIIKE